jgi:hypothetical protein
MGSATTTGHQRIFISYRREEASGHAGRIYDAMVARFGEDNVFMDVDIAPGVDFVDHITNVVSSCTVLIAVMGKSWAETPGPDGLPRLQDEADFVRLEVGTAVQNPDVTVIPALVDKARMPRAEQLPEEMRPLARRNALELSDGRWRYDVGRLNDTLEQLLEGLTGFPAQVQPEPPTPAPETLAPVAAAPAAEMHSEPEAVERHRYSQAEGVRFVLEGIVVAAVAAYLGRLLVDKIPESETTVSEIAAVVARRTGAWGLTGLALAAWLGLRTKRADFIRVCLLGAVFGVVAGAVGGLLWGLPTKLPNREATTTGEHAAEVLAMIGTGAIIGRLLGALWRPPRLGAATIAGLVSGAVIQLIVNAAGLSGKEMPTIGYAFGIRAAVVSGATLAVLVALDLRRSTSSARAPAAR